MGRLITAWGNRERCREGKPTIKTETVEWETERRVRRSRAYCSVAVATNADAYISSAFFGRRKTSLHFIEYGF